MILVLPWGHVNSLSHLNLRFRQFNCELVYKGGLCVHSHRPCLKTNHTMCSLTDVFPSWWTWERGRGTITSPIPLTLQPVYILCSKNRHYYVWEHHVKPFQMSGTPRENNRLRHHWTWKKQQRLCNIKYIKAFWN